MVATLLKGRDEVTIKRASSDSEDEFGNPIEFFEDILVKGCLVANSSESISQELFGDSVSYEKLIIFPKTMDIRVEDIISFKGDIYRLASAPVNWTHALGSMIKPRTLLAIQRSEG